MTTELHPVTLEGLPVRLWKESRIWFQELLREFDVIKSETSDIPTRLIIFVDEVSGRFGQFSRHVNLDLEEAHDRGKERLDVLLELPTEAGPAAEELWSLIVQADEYCRNGKLLTLGLADEHRAFIEWYLLEASRQLAGNPPRPWTSRSDV